MNGKTLIPLDLALGQLLDSAKAIERLESVPLIDADGRVLAQDVVSALQVPAHDNSSMDGYALRCQDVSAIGTVLPISQRIAAGSSAKALLPGSVARIFTGAPIPPGADAVIPQEQTSLMPHDPGQEVAQLRIDTVPLLGQWIRRSGEDVGKNQVVLARGQRLGPAELGLAASIGMDRMAVTARPRVALFSTGNELIMPGDIAPENMPPGAIYNSNRYFLRSLLQRSGCEVADLGIVPDRLDSSIAALRTAAQTCDVILTSGGVSVGEEDHIKAAVQSLGALEMWQIAIKPGKPFAFGRVGGSYFLGLPGNPVSSFVTFLLLVRPFLLRLQGVPALAAPGVDAIAHFRWPRPDFRREFLRVRRNVAGGLDLFGNQSSGVLTSVAWADGLVDLPAGMTIAPGDIVRFLPFSELLS
jgi:molybdopterin molybdotransferase